MTTTMRSELMRGSGSVGAAESLSHSLFGRSIAPTAHTSPRSGKVKPIEIHDLVPRSHEVTHKCLLRVITRVDFRNGSELRV